jgi:uncharacterized protein
MTMRIFFTFLILVSFCANGISQPVPNYHFYEKMTPSQLQAYRQSIWDTLPAAVGWISDFEGLFTSNQEDSLERMLEHFEKLTSVEIAIVTIDSNMVEQSRFNEFAYRLLKVWGIGKINKSNGMVICISKDYHNLYICTDFGIDKFINERDKYNIIKKQIMPFYAKNNYYHGTLAGLSDIIARINKKWSKYNK